MNISSLRRDGPCVYQIECVVTGKIYVGSTKQGFVSRIKAHTKALIKGTHHSRHLQRAWDKYGPEAFVAIPLVWLPGDLSLIRQVEKRAIEVFKSADPEFGYNICKDPEHSTAGTTLSEEHREKLRQAKLGKKRGPYGPRKKETKPRKSRGVALSEEHKKKVSEGLTGKIYGPRSEETKKKMRKAAEKRWQDPEQRRNQAKNLQKQRDQDPEFASKAGKIGAQVRWEKE